MAISEKLKVEVLTKCRRYCALCGKFYGTNIELHHIIHRSDGGEDSFDNIIPLCFNCHANVEHYNSKHPKGTKYIPEELKKRRDLFYVEIEKTPVVETAPEPVSNLAPYLYVSYMGTQLFWVYNADDIINFSTVCNTLKMFMNEMVITDEQKEMIDTYIDNLKNYVKTNDSLDNFNDIKQYISDLRSNILFLENQLTPFPKKLAAFRLGKFLGEYSDYTIDRKLTPIEKNNIIKQINLLDLPPDISNIVSSKFDTIFENEFYKDHTLSSIYNTVYDYLS